MIRFFKSTQPALMIIIPIVVLVFWLRTFFHSLPVYTDDAMPFWNLFASFFTSMPQWLNFTLIFILLSAEAIYFNLVLNKYEVLYKNTFLPALMFAFFVSCCPAFMQLHPVHLINILLIRIFDRAFALYKSEFPVSALFDSGMLAGIAALIYLPAIILLPVLISSLAVLRPFRIKEWLIMLIAFFLPYFFFTTYLFCTNSLIPFWHRYLNIFATIKPEFQQDANPKFLFLCGYIVLLLFFSLFKLRMNYRKNVIRTRIYQQVLFIFLISGMAGMILLKSIAFIEFAFLLIPVTVFCSYYFISAKKRLWLYEYGMWILIAVIVWNNL